MTIDGGAVESPPTDHDGDAARPDSLVDALTRLLDADRVAIVLFGLDRRVTTANRVALDLFGCTTVDDLADDSAAYVLVESLLDQAPRHLARGEDDGVWRGDIDATDPRGEPLTLGATVIADRDAGFIGLIAHDVTASRAEAARLRQRASHDPLTGLANRRQILAVLTRTIALQRHRPGQVATVFIDLDRLKYVNDALGHQVGDRLLTSVAHRLAAIIRPQDQVARIGGDEFLVVCADLGGEDDAMEIAERIRTALTGRLRLRHLDLSLSVSIGVALLDPEDSTERDTTLAATLVSRADTAMYEAKGSGRGRSVLFTPAMQSATRERTLLGAELSRAIDERRLTVEYQPVFSAVSSRAAGAEALVRWTHPARGTIEPAEFVAIAEQSGTIGKLGQFVLETALAQWRRWHDLGVIDGDFAVHVNVSPIQLASPSFVDLVVDLADQYAVPHAQLVLEARESTLFGRNSDVDRSVRALRRHGVRFAIDNFGAGAGALAVFTEVGADLLKVDASGTGRTDGDGASADLRLLRAIVVLAHALGMVVVAERVATPELLTRARAAGCDLVQGNLLAAASSPSALVTTSAS